MEIPLDYATLRVIWWLLLGVLLVAFALTDGYDLGVGALLPFVAKTDEERRMVINTIGPMWEGHQVWFILGGGAIFAAWPFVYAVSFSGLYLAMFIVLCALILRPVGFKYRSKRESPRWRNRWDWALFVGCSVPILVFGVAVGNVLLGLPFRLDSDLRSFYEGSLLGLFTPFPLLCGLVSVCMLVLHGAAWLCIKAEHGPVRDRARHFGAFAAIGASILFAAGYLFLHYGEMGFRLVEPLDLSGPSNPLRATIERADGAWLANYSGMPILWILPLLGVIGPLVALQGMRRGNEILAFGGSSLAVIGIIGSVGTSLFPFILPSSLDPGSSLTAWTASSSHLTLFIMLIVTVLLLPIVLAYTSWAFKVMFGRVTTEQVRTNPDYY